MPIRTIHSTCEYCGTGFEQPDDPGRRRRYCSNAHRQADYRLRKDRREREARRRESEDWFRTWNRIKSQSSRKHPGRSSKAERVRWQVEQLRAKAASCLKLGPDFAIEAELCRNKADELTAKYLNGRVSA